MAAKVRNKVDFCIFCPFLAKNKEKETKTGQFCLKSPVLNI
jgi:hypothetical protein